MKIRIKIDWAIAAFVLFFARDTFYSIFRNIIGNDTISNILCLAPAYLILLFVVCRRKWKSDTLMLLLIVLCLFIGTFLVNPDYQYAMFELPRWNVFQSVFNFSGGIFAYLFFRVIDDPKRLRKALRISAYVLLFWCAVRIGKSILQGGFSRVMEYGIRSSASYDMQLGYRLMLVSIVCGLDYFELNGRKKYVSGVISVVAAAAMVIYGARTSSASFVVFWVLKVLFCSEKKISTRKIVFLLMLTVCAFLLTNTWVLQMMANVLNKLNINSRILNTIVAGEITLDKGRNRMWMQSIQMIRENPIFGAGIYADRAAFGIYCHQIILEVLLNFGVIVGGVLLLLLAVNCVRCLRSKDQDWRLLFVIFFSMWIVRLMLSSSYWIDTNFWASIAIMANMYIRKKRC